MIRCKAGDIGVHGVSPVAALVFLAVSFVTPGEEEKKEVAAPEAKKTKTDTVSRDPAYAEGYEYGCRVGRDDGRSVAQRQPPADGRTTLGAYRVVLPLAVAATMLRRLGPLAYERWKEGYLTGYQKGYAEGLAELASTPEEKELPSPKQAETAPKPPPDGFGSVKLGMRRADVHVEVRTWGLRATSSGLETARWQGAPFPGVRAMGFHFSDSMDLIMRDTGKRYFQPEDAEKVPRGMQDEELESIVVYFDRYSGSDREFLDRLQRVYGNPYTADRQLVGDRCWWVWPEEDREICADLAQRSLNISRGLLAETSVQPVLAEFRQAWALARGQETLDALESALRGEARHPSSLPIEVLWRHLRERSKPLVGTWRVHGRERGSLGEERWEGYLALKLTDEKDVAGDLVWIEYPYKSGDTLSAPYVCPLRAVLAESAITFRKGPDEGAPHRPRAFPVALLVNPASGRAGTEREPSPAYAAVFQPGSPRKTARLVAGRYSQGYFSWWAEKWPDGKEGDIPEDLTGIWEVRSGYLMKVVRFRPLKPVAGLVPFQILRPVIKGDSPTETLEGTGYYEALSGRVYLGAFARRVVTGFAVINPCLDGVRTQPGRVVSKDWRAERQSP